jgi:hypothetical protein
MRYFLLSVVFVFTAMYFHANSNKEDTLTCFSNKKEVFEDFLMKFCYDESFQADRIKFPLLYMHLNADLTESDTVFLQLKDWEYTNLGFDPEIELRSQIYDNFDHSLKDTDERVFALFGIRDGLEIYYYFKRINQEWFLVKCNDLST